MSPLAVIPQPVCRKPWTSTMGSETDAGSVDTVWVIDLFRKWTSTMASPISSENPSPSESWALPTYRSAPIVP